MGETNEQNKNFFLILKYSSVIQKKTYILEISICSLNYDLLCVISSCINILHQHYKSKHPDMPTNIIPVTQLGYQCTHQGFIFLILPGGEKGEKRGLII